MAIETINPATGERVRQFTEMRADEIEHALARASDAAIHWRSTPIAGRAAVVRRAGEILEREKRDLGKLMTLEMGKPIGAAVAEASKCADCCHYYAEHVERFLADEPVAVEGEESFVAWQPLGVVLAVMPWNFPFWQVIRFAAPALAAGNVGVLKHASNVPQCALALERIFRDAGAPEGVFQSLLVGSAAVPAILADDRIAAATLTGSEGAGRSVAEHAGKHIKKTVLELGGSDPFIVMPSADLAAAVTTAVKARTINNGQSCIAAKRFIVHEAVADAFERRFVAAMRELVVGDPMDERTEIGPLASAQIRDDLHAQVQRTVQMGARLATGGTAREGPGFFYEPTVLLDVPADSPAAREELFGPVAPVFRARDAEHAIAIANSSRFGLGASAFTSERDEAYRFARELASGTVFVNGMVASDPRFPFGGVKASGYGRELSAMGMREFLNAKTVRIKQTPEGRGHATE